MSNPQQNSRRNGGHRRGHSTSIAIGKNLSVDASRLTYAHASGVAASTGNQVNSLRFAPIDGTNRFAIKDGAGNNITATRDEIEVLLGAMNSSGSSVSA